jgi:triosephosphate isomerase (TIM)
MRQLIAGNWKMNGLSASLSELEAVAAWVHEKTPAADVLICPPASLLARAAILAHGRIALGGQDCHPQPSGAFTGDISAEMLKDAGASAVIVGHSERRKFHRETDALVHDKVRAAWRAQLLSIICVGETEDERDAGRAHEVVVTQLAGSVPAGAHATNTAIAYEPVWAIGTGRTPSIADIEDMHAHIRASLTDPAIRVLYGGSANPANAREILRVEGVDGALVGGASLKAADFQVVIAANRNSQSRSG